MNNNDLKNNDPSHQHTMQYLKEILDNAPENTIIVTGAGVSTPSGIPDFKTLNAQRILSRYYAEGHRDEYYNFVETQLKNPNIEKNWVHLLLEQYTFPIITQNIDGLHQNGEIYEIHGTISKAQCYYCDFKIDKDYTELNDTICPDCNVKGCFEPAIVLYDDNIDYDMLNEIIDLFKNADQIIVLGTRLQVNPIYALVKDHAHKAIYINNEASLGIDFYKQIMMSF